jgi:UDP-N-acetylglucosamine 1-carboxyvinyltransferase
MDKIRIIGGKPLKGTIAISGSKNSALPALAATLLTDEKVTLSNVPDLHDITSMLTLLAQHGVEYEITGESSVNGSKERRITLQAKNIHNFEAPYELVRKMRASFLVLGPLLTRFGQARVSLPGGCAIGTRPVDMHIDALKQMGAEIEIAEGYINGKAPQGLKGADISFKVPSVGATENTLMAAVLAKGTTIIRNAAQEPEILDLANLLIKMGANISGAGTDTITIEGVTALKGATHEVISDRIEGGTYAVAAAITGGDLKLVNVDPSLFIIALDCIKKIGCHVEMGDDWVRIKPNGGLLPINIDTAPYPGLATDLQAQFMALLCLAKGRSTIHESIWEHRFMHVPELARLGANIEVNGSIAYVDGVASLKGAQLMATDLRASASLVLAALAAEGESIVNRIYHLDRGYEKLEEKLQACGANIERIA